MDEGEFTQCSLVKEGTNRRNMYMKMFVQQIEIIPTAQWMCIEVPLIISAHAKALYSYSISLQVLSKFSGSCFHKSDILTQRLT